MESAEAKAILNMRRLGHATVRLVPKGCGVRPIMNLSRRAVVLRNGRPALGQSINSMMKPVQSMLTFEKTRQPERLGSSLFNVDDMSPRLKEYKSRWDGAVGPDPHFYFVKVDVRSSFDTIPQWSVLRLVESLCSEDAYRLFRYSETTLDGSSAWARRSTSRPKPVLKFHHLVNADTRFAKRRTIFTGSAGQSNESKTELMQLLQEHVTKNIVRSGDEYYLQREGIPQGSVVSSILCNLFYARFEGEALEFLNQDDSPLMRLIDDFLLITTDRAKAERFLQTMAAGNEAFGIRIRTEKSLTNFTCAIYGSSIPRVDNHEWFPYCGALIDPRTLNVSKGRERWGDQGSLDARFVLRRALLTERRSA